MTKNTYVNLYSEMLSIRGVSPLSSARLRMLLFVGGVGLLATPAAIADTTPGTSEPTPGSQPVTYSAEELLGADAATMEALVAPSVTVTPDMATPTSVFSSDRFLHSVGSNDADPSSPDAMQVPTPPPVAAEVLIQASPPAPMEQGLTSPSTASSAPAADTVIQPFPSELADGVPAGINSVFIDPTEYSLGATEPTRPDVLLTERSTGCQQSLGANGLGGGCGSAVAPPQGGQAAAASGGGLRVGPVSVDHRGLSINGATVISREFFNEKAKLLNVLRRGDAEYVFPLTLPSPISSLFGWRIHPIYGDARFHAGTDLAAPTGTPVLATRSGRVAVSDFLGGYGLTVILRHDDNQLESRYAHLSQILVQPGEWIEQGEVIGLVGNTGNSTGPHLHFEVRQLTAQGWMAVNPQEVLEYGLANLMEIVNNPLQALALDDTSEAESVESLGDLPYRPAQPNAS